MPYCGSTFWVVLIASKGNTLRIRRHIMKQCGSKGCQIDTDTEATRWFFLCSLQRQSLFYGGVRLPSRGSDSPGASPGWQKRWPVCLGIPEPVLAHLK